MRNLKRSLLGLGTGAGTLVAFAAPILAQTSSDGDAAAGLFVFFIYCCLCVFIIAYLGLKVYLTIDALNRDYGDEPNQKTLGLILIWVVDWFVTFLGLILYYFLIMRKYPKKASA